MSELLTTLGQRVRRQRQARGLTIKELALAAGLSARFVGQLEKGEGNISVSRLDDVARALGVPIGTFFADPPQPEAAHAHVALLGVRGAGKSAVGQRLARRLGRRFVELDARIEDAAGLSLAEIFSIHGEPYYREVEHEVLTRFLADEQAPSVLATGGSIVTHPESWGLLKRHALTVWLKARAKDHWVRVLAQGDDRPMRRNPQAFQQLEALLAARAPLYQQADLVVDTSGRTLEAATEAVTALVT